MYILLAILAFGFIIAIHELGHFLTAKAMNVKVLEFSIGMGPKILSKQGKETLYSLRLIPFGGFCSMEGEYGEQLEDDKDSGISGDVAHTDFVLADGVSPEDIERIKPARIEPEPKTEKPELDPRSFMAQKRWKRIVILAAGSLSNVAAAFVIMLVLTIGSEGYGSTELAYVKDNLPDRGPSEIMTGDKIISINGERLYYYNDYSLFMNLNADRPVTLTLLRDGEYVQYQRRSYIIDGEEVYRYALSFAVIEPTPWESVKYSAYQTFNFIRMIRVSIVMMARGDVGAEGVAGPVRIISEMNTIAQESPTLSIAISNIVYLTAFIGVNVAIINLLPIPAMDGGRILFVFITWVVEKITRRELDPKYENYINTGAFILLIGLMILIMFNDIKSLIGG